MRCLLSILKIPSLVKVGVVTDDDCHGNIVMEFFWPYHAVPELINLCNAIV